MDNSPF